MNKWQEPEHTKPMQLWKKLLILFLMIACIAAAAYHHKDIDTGAVAGASADGDQAEMVEAVTAPQGQPMTELEPAIVMPAETQKPSENTDFSGVALLGNSHIDGFHIYNSLPGADCLYRVGLNVKTVYEKPMLGEKIPIIDKLLEKQYTHILLSFGENELGWQYPEIFIEDYKTLIQTVQERQPNAKIYIQSILPVAAEVSRRNEDNTNNERIRAYNELLRALAEEMQLSYVDAATALQDDKGNLPDNAAADGIHLGQTYNKKWAELIAQQVTEGVTE